MGNGKWTGDPHGASGVIKVVGWCLLQPEWQETVHVYTLLHPANDVHAWSLGLNTNQQETGANNEVLAQMALLTKVGLQRQDQTLALALESALWPINQ